MVLHCHAHRLVDGDFVGLEPAWRATEGHGAEGGRAVARHVGQLGAADRCEFNRVAGPDEVPLRQRQLLQPKLFSAREDCPAVHELCRSWSSA